MEEVKVLSLEFLTYSFGAGAAHGYAATKTMNFRLRPSRKLQLTDVFKSSTGYLEALSRYCLEDLRKQQAQRRPDYEVAVVLFLLSYREFRAAGTSVRGSTRSTTIVRTGPYWFSRNPIYLAFILFVLGLSVWLNNAWLLVTLVPAVGVIARIVIPGEERFLERNIKEQYSSYKGRVRRWF